MKILFLGTGAADWLVEKDNAMAEFRRLSSALIDDVLLIDPGPQVISALKEMNKDVSNIKYVINTHKHSDHFCQETLDVLTTNGAQFLNICAGDEISVGNYVISAYSANHSTCKEAVHFIIKSGEKSIFYGLDGAWLMYDEVQAIMETKPQLAVLDATIGDVKGDWRIFEHNNLNMVREIKKTLNSYVKTFCISHMALTLHDDHKTLAENMKKDGIVAAYDGLELEV